VAACLHQRHRTSIACRSLRRFRRSGRVDRRAVRDDRHLLGPCAVIAAEIAAAQKRNAHRFQVTVADAGHLDADERRSFRLQRYGRWAASEIKRQPIRYGCRRNALALARLSRRLRIRKSMAAALSVSGPALRSNGAAYSSLDSNPRSDLAVERTRSTPMPPMTSRGTAIATAARQ